jgi:hypothetical protein
MIIREDAEPLFALAPSYDIDKEVAVSQLSLSYR